MTERTHELAFEFSRASVAFADIPALDSVDLEIQRGERVALIGPSGAGKTTWMRLANGTLIATAGRVQCMGTDFARASQRTLRAARAQIGCVHQTPSLVPNLRVVQNVVAGALGRRGFVAAVRTLVRPSRADTERAHALLERVGIGDKLFERTDRLSGGQAQRVALARALFQDPTALLADEPVASVDPERARSMIELCVEVAGEADCTLVASLHDHELARSAFERVIGLREGRIVFDRASADVDAAELSALYRLPESPA